MKQFVLMALPTGLFISSYLCGMFFCPTYRMNPATLAIDALRSGSSIEDIPDEIVNNKFVKAYIETCPKTEDTFSSIIEEEIIPIHVD